MGRTLVCGDIHGQLKKLKQVLELCSFKKGEDKLFFLGDYVDTRGDISGDIRSLIDYLIELDETYLLGNHDDWFKHFLNTGEVLPIWYKQGGAETLQSFSLLTNADRTDGLLDASYDKYRIFFNKLKLYVEVEGFFLCHAGYDYEKGPYKSSKQELTWDRDLFFHRGNDAQFPWPRTIVGHTAQRSHKPFIGKNVINIDTGAGGGNPLTIMEIPSLKYWQSD